MTDLTTTSSTNSQTESDAASPATASIFSLTAATEELFRNISNAPGGDVVAELMKTHVQHYSNHHVPMVDFEPGCDWHNVSRSLHLYEDLRGRISVLDFFTYCCINCLHVLPQLRGLEQLHPPHTSPLAVIGVHSAKFSNEKDSEKLAAAICRYDISHPVVNDSQSAMWRKLGIICWPTLVVLGPACEPVFVFVGETHEEELKMGVEYLLRYHERLGAFSDIPPLPLAPSERVRGVWSPLQYPGGVTSCGDDDLVITDTSHHRLLLTSASGHVKEVIGSGKRGFRDGDFSSAEFSGPQGCAVSADGCIYVADTENHAVRKVCLKDRTVCTVAGTGAQGTDLVGGGAGVEQSISSPWDVCLAQLPGDEGAAVLLIAMAGTHQVWALYLAQGTDFTGCPRSAGSLVCVAGSGKEENRNTGYPLKASFAQPSGICTTKIMLPLPTKPRVIGVGKGNLPPVPCRNQEGCIPFAPPPPPPPPLARTVTNDSSSDLLSAPFVASVSVPPPPPPPVSNVTVQASPPPPPPSGPVKTSSFVPPPPPPPAVISPPPPMLPPPPSSSPQPSPMIHGVPLPPPPPPGIASSRRPQRRAPPPPPPHGAPHGTPHGTPHGAVGSVSVAVIADAESSSVRLLRLDTGAVLNVAGGSSDPTDLFAYGDADGVGPKARLQHPLGVAAAPDVLYVADTYNHKIKKVTASPSNENLKSQTPRFQVTSLGIGAGELSEPSGLCVVGSRLYVADTNHHAVKVVDLSSDPPSVSELVLDMSAAAEDETDGKAGASSALGVVLLTSPVPELLKVVVRLALPPGVTLTPDAPSSWTARAEGAEVRLSPGEGCLEAPGTISFTISPPTAGTTVCLSGRLYVCLSSGVCTATALSSSFRITRAAGAGDAIFSVQATGEVDIPLDVVV